MQNTIYERQNKIGNLKIPKVVSIVGCGGTGFWTAIFLAMSGVEELILVDADVVEISNLNRLPLDRKNVGDKKIKAVEGFIRNIREPIRIESHDMKIMNAEDCEVLRGAVFCCTDNLHSQQLICAYCRKNKIPYQRVGYDGTILNVSEAFPLSFEEEETTVGYRITPSWVIPAVMAAASGVSSKLYKNICIMDDIGKLHIQDCSVVPEMILENAREEGKDEILDNIEDHVPDGYGYCDSCSKCDDCRYVDPDDGWGQCDECDKKYTEDEIESTKNESFEDGLLDAVKQITSGEVQDIRLIAALKSWEGRKSNV